MIFTGRRLDGYIASADDLDAAVCRLDTALSETLNHQRTVRSSQEATDRPDTPNSSLAQLGDHRRDEIDKQL